MQFSWTLTRLPPPFLLRPARFRVRGHCGVKGQTGQSRWPVKAGQLNTVTTVRTENGADWTRGGGHAPAPNKPRPLGQTAAAQSVRAGQNQRDVKPAETWRTHGGGGGGGARLIISTNTRHQEITLTIHRDPENPWLHEKRQHLLLKSCTRWYKRDRERERDGENEQRERERDAFLY